MNEVAEIEASREDGALSLATLVEVAVERCRCALHSNRDAEVTVAVIAGFYGNNFGLSVTHDEKRAED